MADGGCIDFGRLPPGWRPARQVPVRIAAKISGLVQGAPVEAALHTDAVYTDVYAPTVIGWRRLPFYDVPGFKAWAADDGELVLADGDRKSYRIIIECEPASPRLRTPAICHASDHHMQPGRLLEIDFRWRDLRAAQALIHGAEAAAAKLPRSCPG